MNTDKKGPSNIKHAKKYKTKALEQTDYEMRKQREDLNCESK